MIAARGRSWDPERLRSRPVSATSQSDSILLLLIYHWPSVAPSWRRGSEFLERTENKPKTGPIPSLCLLCFAQADLDGFPRIQYSPPLS